MFEGIAVQTIIFSIIFGAIGIAFSDKFKIPGILLFFFMGILFSPNFLDIINPSALGQGLNIMIAIFVIIILFEGGMSLNMRHVRSLWMPLFKDISLSIIVMICVGFFAARFIVGLPWEVSIVFSSIIIVTGPTVIKPIIRYIPLDSKVKNFLNGESVLIDAVGAILTIIVLQFVLTSNELSHSILGFIRSLFIGVVSGVLFGLFIRLFINKTKILTPANNGFLVLAVVFISYIASEILQPESGLLTVVIVGLILSTIDFKYRDNIFNFIEQITRIFISILFVLLAANFNLKNVTTYLVDGSIIIGLIILSRFIIIFLSTAKSTFTFREKIFISWLGPRGIVALSIASIAGIKLSAAGVENAHAIETLVFMLISVTVLLQGMSATWVAEKLKIVKKGDGNIIILGVNNISLAIAEKWRDDKTDVIFIDSNKKNCKLAEQKGFPCSEGNGLEPVTYSSILMDNYTSALATSENNEINVLFCSFLKENFGIENLYTILNEKASVELAEMMDYKDIKLAFVARNRKEENLSVEGFLSKLKGLFSYKEESIAAIVPVTNRNFLSYKPGTYPFPDDVIILAVLRNNTERYIYHTSFQLQLDDKLYVMGLPESVKNLKTLLSID
ncbi:MAG: K(+)/H(+) antiporter NhaP [Spirochaetes bacterium ADurb.Bin218]|jgi:NhaP-type Na+/H+ or K+/H+ antiporter|nr:sodium:proton antiporter [Spirochaetota bacterium]OQA98812.1 MAG: K(+)/H(+) antiporter NhaP [Spirochaetes bacterium ADurb.Bin218]HOV09133.1 sodium:proton antiporter [Spirochaetota bacterium]